MTEAGHASFSGSKISTPKLRLVVEHLRSAGPREGSPDFPLSEEMLYDFEREVARSLRPIPPSHLCEAATDALIISMDVAWQPFHCESRGPNPEPSRRYLDPRIPFLSWLISGCKAHAKVSCARRAGGRYFLTAEGAYRKPEGEPKIWVTRWSLPRNSHLLPSIGTRAA